MIKSCPFGGVVHNFVWQNKMFRNPDLLEKTNMARYDLSTPLTLPGNGQKQDKDCMENLLSTAEINGLIGITPISELIIPLKLQLMVQAIAAADTQSSTLNGSASLINKT